MITIRALALATALVLAGAHVARADAGAGVDAGDSDAGAIDAAADSGETPPYGIAESSTAGNYGCSTGGAGTPMSGFAGAAFAIAALLLSRRRSRRAGLASLVVVAAVASAPAAHAVEAALDAPSPLPPPPPRSVAVSYNPLTLQLSRLSANLEIALGSHHIFEASPFFAYTRTNSDSNNVFSGVGAELGYRYYFGEGGMRGLYVGPAVLLGFYSAQAATGQSTTFQNFGGALDVGYQAIVADRVVLGLGTGVQYTVPTLTFLPQELPASVYAVRGLRPRLLFAVGVAF
jgi:hypothetical protein